MTLDAQVQAQVPVIDARDGVPAGIVTRASAYIFDLILTSLTLTIAAAGATFLFRLLSSGRVSINAEVTELATIGAGSLWWIVLITYTTVSFGQSPGMALFGLRVECGDGRKLHVVRGALRAVLVPFLLAITFGIDALFVLGRKRLALHDRLLGTRVVYGHGRLTRRIT